MAPSTTRLAKSRPLSDRQIEALKIYIAGSKDASNFGKRLCFWLIDQSNNLTRPVCVSIPKNCPGTPKGQIELCEQLLNSIHDMISGGNTTHLNSLLTVASTTFRFSVHGGIYDEQGELNNFHGYTAWLSPHLYDDKATRLRLDLEKINAIRLADASYFGGSHDLPEPKESVSWVKKRKQPKV